MIDLTLRDFEHLQTINQNFCSVEMKSHKTVFFLWKRKENVLVLSHSKSSVDVRS